MTASILDRFRRQPQPVILMYHRIASPVLDPWEIAVSATHFESQIEALADRRTILPMAEFAARHANGNLPRDAVAITFDDGYSDNVGTAAPILAGHEVPATLFIATAYVGRHREFWWDKLARLVLLHPGVAQWELPSLDRRVGFGDDDHLAGTAKWRGWDPPATRRQRVFQELWAFLRLLPLAQIEAALEALADQSAAPAAAVEDFPATVAALRRSTASGLMMIGAHTHTHRPLASIATDEAREDIVSGKGTAEAISELEIAGLAYPYGDCNAAVAAMARSAGFAWACTTRTAVVRHRRRDDQMLLPRVAVRDEPGEALLRHLDDLAGAKGRA